jgi:hypothetical protein
MKETEGYISITITGKTPDGFLNPKDIDISETKELLSDVENLLFPTKNEKENRPLVSYEVKEGSVKNIFFIPAAKVIMFTALMNEVAKQGSTQLLEPQQANVLDKWQQRAYKAGRTFSFSSSINDNENFLTISHETKFIVAQTDWINTSMYLYGEIYEEGGLNKSNLHILTARYGKLTVGASKEQLTTGTNKLYNVYGLWVKGKQNVKSGELKELSLIDFIPYNQDYDEVALNILITNASKNWSRIKNADRWLEDVRGGENG